MKVLLRKNVPSLGNVGDVVSVKVGYARNYLLPQGLAYEPTEMNLKAIEAEKQKYLEELARQRLEIEAKAAVVQGKEVTITARANEQGYLYGSVGPAQIAAALAADGVFIETQDIVLEHPIEQLDKYDVTVRFAEGVTATVHVWVVPAIEAHPDDDTAEPDVAAPAAPPAANTLPPADQPATHAQPDEEPQDPPE